MRSKNYSIYEAKTHFSEIVRAVKTGKRIIVTDRKVPVAEVIPYTPHLLEDLNARIETLVGMGAVLPASKLPRDLKKIRVIPAASRNFLKLDRD